jgi:hypothetical protein
MKVFKITYYPNNYSSCESLKEVYVVAPDALKATADVSKKMFLGYSGRVTSVTEHIKSVRVAK